MTLPRLSSLCRRVLALAALVPVGATAAITLTGGNRVARLEGQRQPQGVAFAPSMQQLFVANGDGDAIEAFQVQHREMVIEHLCGADDLFLDAQRHRLCAICDEGRIDVIGLGARDRYERVQTIETAPGARTSLLVPALNEPFVAAPARGRSAAVLVVRLD